jgi:hypothetical protein
MLCPPAPGEQELAPFIDDYLGAAGAGVNAEDYIRQIDFQPPPDQPPYRVGRVAVVDIDEHRIDGKLTRALPAEIVATRAEEVGTVIWVRWGETREGTYHANGVGPATGQAYRGYCDIAVIDLAAGLIVGAREFLAASPPATTTASGDIHTEVDVESVVNWVSALPVHDTAAPPATPPTSETPATSPKPTSAAHPALAAGDSFKFSGDQVGQDVVIPEERFDLVAGDYRVHFKGRASNACTSCVTVDVIHEPDEDPTFVIDRSDRVDAGRWDFAGLFTVGDWEEGTFHFELSMPKGTWTITLTRVN